MISGAPVEFKAERGVYPGLNQCKIRNFRAAQPSLVIWTGWWRSRVEATDFSRAGTDSWSREFLRAACKCVPLLRDKLTPLLAPTLPHRTRRRKFPSWYRRHKPPDVSSSVDRLEKQLQSRGYSRDGDGGGMTSHRYIGWRATNCTVALYCLTFDSTNDLRLFVVLLRRALHRKSLTKLSPTTCSPILFWVEPSRRYVFIGIKSHRISPSLSQKMFLNCFSFNASFQNLVFGNSIWNNRGSELIDKVHWSDLLRRIALPPAQTNELPQR